MLLKNGELYKPEWGKYGFADKPKAEVTFQRSKNNSPAVKFDKKGKKKRGPKSFYIEAFYTLINKEGDMDEYRYYKSIRNRKIGGIEQAEYSPSYATHLDGRGMRVLDQSDLDLIFFMMHHPRNAASPFKDKKKSPWMYTEDLKKEATGNADRSRQLAEALAMIYDEKAGLDSDMLREVAKSFGRAGIDGKTDDQVRLILEKIAMKDPAKFIEGTSGHSIKVRALIQEAIDRKIISYNKGKKTFYTITNGKEDMELCKVQFADDPAARLLKYLTAIDDGLKLKFLNEEVLAAKNAEAEAKDEEIVEEI